MRENGAIKCLNNCLNLDLPDLPLPAGRLNDRADFLILTSEHLFTKMIISSI